MPARQPFTALCQTAARSPSSGRADLHLHTCFSDGSYTPAQIVDLARRSGLAAVAITDHDTTAGVGPALAAAAGTGVEIVPGVEITAEHRQRELHLLAYFVRTNDPALTAALQRICEHRVGRFHDMVDRLRQRGVALPENITTKVDTVLGRRHLAEQLVAVGRAGSVREAFHRYLGDENEIVVPKLRLPAAETITLVRGAGGVASWAHPFYDDTRSDLARLRDLGLQAVEVEYPGYRPGRVRQLRTWAAEYGLAVTGGSDCHGPGPRAPGCRSITGQELALLRQLVSS